jgi:acyl carrier protein
MQGVTGNAISKVREWIVQKNSSIHPDVLTEDIDLIENRIIDSLQFVEFILFLEEITGRDVYTQEFKLDSVKTMRAIEENYFSKEA